MVVKAAELVLPVLKAAALIQPKAANTRNNIKVRNDLSDHNCQMQLTAGKRKKERSDRGKKRVKKIMKIAWYEESRWYKVSNQWIKLDDENVSICGLYLLIIYIIGTCLSTF